MWHQTLYSPNEFVEFGFQGNTRATFRNRLTIGLDAEIIPVPEHDYYEARTEGRVFIRPEKWTIGGFLSPDYRKAFIVDVRANIERSSKYNQTEWAASVSPRWRVNDNLSFRLNSFYESNLNDIGYVNENSNVSGFGEIIFGRRNLQTFENVLSTTYIFNNLLALDFRLRHYWLLAKYDKYYGLQQDGDLEYKPYDRNNDFNFNAFNIDMVLRWEFAPGSELALAWKNALLTNNESDITNKFFDNLRHTLESPADNSFSVKLLYYLDYAYLKKHQ